MAAGGDKNASKKRVTFAVGGRSPARENPHKERYSSRGHFRHQESLLTSAPPTTCMQDVTSPLTLYILRSENSPENTDLFMEFAPTMTARGRAVTRPTEISHRTARTPTPFVSHARLVIRTQFEIVTAGNARAADLR
ncbi:hypothetical protein EVAR_43685_1 [Eumeta japonica]|uniref:Uncharacterized protein n=1 Tax=Eumeta variegata TaxID=151549 RepID=A0A4C1X0L4_EUMVA|nr:hypothetical protein EVAR_43685_1 [Eumeta japonica]